MFFFVESCLLRLVKVIHDFMRRSKQVVKLHSCKKFYEEIKTSSEIALVQEIL
jgi:hypothetical protein